MQYILFCVVIINHYFHHVVPSCVERQVVFGASICLLHGELQYDLGLMTHLHTLGSMQGPMS